tara:strand:+ start:24725 stop:24892 length:168 start_codon:yes stop_codon:yes gene_type:complete
MMMLARTERGYGSDMRGFEGELWHDRIRTILDHVKSTRPEREFQAVRSRADEVGR